MVTPTAGVTWLSEDMANYDYGTLGTEVAKGVIDYKPDAAAIPHVGVNFIRMLDGNWSMIGFLKYSFLPDELNNSPLLDPDSHGGLRS